MPGTTAENQPDPRVLADLSALADGTLDPARRAEVQASIDASPELRHRFAQERRAVTLLSAARERDRAPAGLRARLSGNESARMTPTRNWIAAPATRAALVAAVAAIAIALVLVLPAGTPGAPSVSQAATVAFAGPNLAAPAPGSPASARLPVAVGQLHFPNWATSLGWDATGQRVDRVGGRLIRTVYYSKAGRTVAYTIVSGGPLSQPNAPGDASGNYYVHFLRLRGRNVVTWREAGHTCMLSGSGLSERVLRMLVSHA